MPELTGEMRRWLKEALLGMGVPEDYIYEDPTNLIWQVREHALMGAESLKWYSAQVNGPSEPIPKEFFPNSTMLPKLQELFPNPPMNGFLLSDLGYDITTLAEMGRFVAWYRKYWLPHFHYIGEGFDCDNFAIVFRALGSIATTWSSLAWGEIWGAGGTWGRTGHAFNIFFAKVDEEIRPYFLEPQSGDIVEISGEVLEDFQPWLIKI